MGQKSNPKSLRIKYKGWESNWFPSQNNQYKDFAYSDFVIRGLVNKELERAGVSDIRILRKAKYTEVYVVVARPGIIFGKNAIDLGVLNNSISNKCGSKISIKVLEQKNPDTSSKLLAQWISGQLEKRVPFRRAMKMAVKRCKTAGGLGIKIICSGRLGGVEIARSESYKEGKVPLGTFRTNIDYSFTEALTTYGKIGIKVWVNKGDHFEEFNYTLPDNQKKNKKDKKYVNAKKN
ncbi:30S ribosomal protein S3 [Candidatus Marinamargulisbacteria bacterium SCGC AG-410-N11]|nr:30S ribosomal protein S3 [Candidatus Marinamargulisbacteria bacterium SCGC AG-410-N11]